MTLQLRKSDRTDRETFVRCKVNGHTRALNLLREVFNDERLTNFAIPSVKLISDRSDRYAITIIFQALQGEKPLHDDYEAQSHLHWIVDKFALVAPISLPAP